MWSSGVLQEGFLFFGGNFTALLLGRGLKGIREDLYKTKQVEELSICVCLTMTGCQNCAAWDQTEL